MAADQACYSNNGMSLRFVPPSYQAQAGEVLFPTYASPIALTAAFPGYAAAAAAQTLVQQAATMLATGCQVASTGTPALNGTYPTDAISQQHVQAEITSILLNGTFADGTSEIEWLDASGVPHAFSVAQFKTLATALGTFVSGVLKVINGQSATLPTQPAQIA
jgi:hypothetical protein